MDTQFLQGEKYLWQLPPINQQAIADIAARFNLSFPLAHTLLTRGFTTQEEIDSFLFSTFEKDVAHPSC